MHRTIIMLGCLLLATPAVAQAPAATSTINSPASITTVDFVKQVAMSDLLEIASARLAVARGGEAEQNFANQMIADHGKTSAELKRMVTGGPLNVELPSQLDSAHQGKLDRLNFARGDEFSALYVAQQVEAHREAVALFERYAANGDQPELKQWAAQTVPALKHHLDMAMALDKQRNAAPTVGSSTSK